MASITKTVTFSHLDCSECGLTFAVPDFFMENRREDHRNFWCPNGHGQHYPQDTEAEILRKRLDKELSRSAALLAEKDQVEASLRATKGQLTKAKRRAANGVCPCCHRTFKDLARHVKGQHPGFITEMSV